MERNLSGLFESSKNNILTVPEIAREARLSKSTVYRAISDGRLPALRAGRSVRVAKRHAIEFLIKGAVDGFN